MHWILIYWITTGSMGSYGGLHNSTSSVIFDDETACHSAFQAMRAARNNDDNDHGIWAVCVPQGSKS